MSCGVAISKELCGKDLYYKYLLFSPFLSPAEILFIKKPVAEEINYCFRVWEIPDCTSDLSGLYQYCVSFPFNSSIEMHMFVKCTLHSLTIFSMSFIQS